MGWPFAVMQDIRNLERSRLLQAGLDVTSTDTNSRHVILGTTPLNGRHSSATAQPHSEPTHVEGLMTKMEN